MKTSRNGLFRGRGNRFRRTCTGAATFAAVGLVFLSVVLACSNPAAGGGSAGDGTTDGGGSAGDETTKSWQTVGVAGFSAGRADYTSLAFDSSGTPCVAYSDGPNGHKATVMKWSGGSWQPVGSAGFSPGEACSVSLPPDSSATPYVAYT